MTAVSVLIADRQLLFADALADALSVREELVVLEGRPQTAGALVEAATAHGPGVALVDYYLDVVAAGDVAAAMSARCPDVKVVFLSWLHHEDGVRRVLDAGAVGYLPKSCDLDLVAEAVARAHDGERPVFGENLDKLLGDLEERRVAAQQSAKRLAGLTPRELEVLEWLATGRTVPAIAEQLGVTAQTVQTHIRNLKRKTGARTQLEAVRLAHGKAAVCLPDSLPL